MPDRSPPRVALLGFSIECNKFAPPATKAHFLARTYLEGDAIVRGGPRADPDHAAGDTGLCRGDGRFGAVDPCRHRAGDDRA